MSGMASHSDPSEDDAANAGGQPEAGDGHPEPGDGQPESADVPGDAEGFEDLADLEQLLGDDVRKVAAERDEYLDSLRRLQADFDNFRKRALRQQTETLERAGEGVVRQLLPVLDALDLAAAHANTSGEQSDAEQALVQIATLLRDTLAREGLERIDEVGVGFDPTVHDAVAHEAAADPADAAVPADTEAGSTESTGETGETGETGDTGERAEEAGDTPGAGRPAEHDAQTVTGVLRPGYRLKGRVIRPAMVKVRG
jgi:molecular chaperone GrpE